MCLHVIRKVCASRDLNKVRGSHVGLWERVFQAEGTAEAKGLRWEWSEYIQGTAWGQCRWGRVREGKVR